MSNTRLAVVIDDLRSFPDLEPRFDVRYARTAKDGVELLNQLREDGVTIDVLLLDHDLGEIDGVKTDIRPVLDLLGECAVWDNPYPVKQIVVHSSNSDGAAMMVRSMGLYYKARRVPSEAVGNSVL